MASQKMWSPKNKCTTNIFKEEKVVSKCEPKIKWICHFKGCIFNTHSIQMLCKPNVKHNRNMMKKNVVIKKRRDESHKFKPYAIVSYPLSFFMMSVCHKRVSSQQIVLWKPLWKCESVRSNLQSLHDGSSVLIESIDRICPLKNEPAEWS